MDARFCVKEVDMGLAADVGTLQRLPRVIGSRSLVSDLCLTARKMESQEAERCGLVSQCFPDVAPPPAAANPAAAATGGSTPGTDVIMPSLFPTMAKGTVVE